jgi:hypothetical protein
MRCRTWSLNQAVLGLSGSETKLRRSPVIPTPSCAYVRGYFGRRDVEGEIS